MGDIGLLTELALGEKESKKPSQIDCLDFDKAYKNASLAQTVNGLQLCMKNGLFKDFYKEVCRSLSDTQMDEFGELNTDADRVKYVWRLVQDIKVEPSFKSKDLEEAEKWRLQGNKAYQGKDFAKALHLYSKSLIHAPPDSECYALSLGNRSAVLFQLERWTHCLSDIYHALQVNFPKRLHYKLQERCGSSYVKLGRKKKAIAAFKLALKALDDSDLEKNARNDWEKGIREKLIFCTSTRLQAAEGELKKLEVPDVSGKRHERYPSASQNLDFVLEPEQGRHAVAAKTIKIGEIILVEAPHASILSSDKREQFCQVCLRRFLAPVPCPTCCSAAFCSMKCRDAALSSFHKYECPIHDLLFDSGISDPWYLALRILTKAGLKYFTDDILPKIKGQRDKPDESALWSDPKTRVYDPRDYMSVYNLVSHATRRSIHDFFCKTVMSLFLLKCLQHSSFFSRHEEGERCNRAELSSDEVLVGTLLLRNLQVVQFNAHEVIEYNVKGEGQYEGEGFAVGTALYPTVCLFNHSCEPFLARYFVGDEIVLRSLKNVKVGEGVYDNYGPVFFEKGRTERQEMIWSSHWFNCECRPCVEHWPTFSEMDTSDVCLQCSKCHAVLMDKMNSGKIWVKCDKCGKKMKRLRVIDTLDETYKTIRRAQGLMALQKVDEALELFIGVMTTLQTCVAPPDCSLHACLQFIRQCMLGSGSVHVNGSLPSA